ncbi:MAG: MFS transporter [bacterium]
MNRGWFVLMVITLFEGLAGFGRTTALSPFLKDLCHDLSLTTAQIGGAYTLANLFAGFFLPKIGLSYDNKGPAKFMRLYVCLFGGAFIMLSMMNFLELHAFFNFCLFALGFTVIRASVHAYAVVGRSTIAVWFDKNRGIATAISCFILSTIASSVPWLNFQMHKYYEWFQVWLVLGVLWVVLLPWLCIFIKKPAGIVTEQKTPIKRRVRGDFSKKPVFWIIMTALFLKAFQNTGVAFHLIPMCEDFGANPELVTQCLILVSVITNVMTFFCGYFFEKIGSKYSLFLFLILDCFYLFCLKNIAHPYALWGFVFFAGCYWGMNQIVSYMVLPNIFGTKHIGTINGWASSCMCLGSSLGPFVIGLFTSYRMALVTLMGVANALLVIGFLFRKKMQPLNDICE